MHGSYGSIVLGGGTLKIQAGHLYELDDYQGGNPHTGTYSYKASSGRVIWESGFCKQKGWKSTYHPQGPSIDVHTPDGGYNTYTYYVG